MKYFLNIIILLIFLSLPSCNRNDNKQKPEKPAEIKDDQKQIQDISFELIKEIKITNNLLLGSIWHLSCFQNKEFLITDNIGKKVYLIDNNGNLLKELNPEVCNPGFNWNPLYSFFNKEGDIYIINSLPWGFRFSRTGNCLGPMSNAFLGTFSVDFKTNGEVIGYYAMEDGNYLKAMSPDGKEIKKFGEFPKEFKNIIFHFEYGGIITDDNDNIYQLTPVSTKIVKYDKHYKKICEFEYLPDDFFKVREDINLSDNPQELIFEISKKLEGKTFSNKIFSVNKKMLAVQYSRNNSYGLILYYTSGEPVIKKNINFNKRIMASSDDGYIYTVEEAKPDKDGNLPNPSIQVYKLTAK